MSELILNLCVRERKSNEFTERPALRAAGRIWRNRKTLAGSDESARALASLRCVWLRIKELELP